MGTVQLYNCTTVSSQIFQSPACDSKLRRYVRILGEKLLKFYYLKLTGGGSCPNRGRRKRNSDLHFYHEFLCSRRAYFVIKFLTTVHLSQPCFFPGFCLCRWLRSVRKSSPFFWRHHLCHCRRSFGVITFAIAEEGVKFRPLTFPVGQLLFRPNNKGKKERKKNLIILVAKLPPPLKTYWIIYMF